MYRESILIWGTGAVAVQTLSSCMTVNLYNILGFIDNDKTKWNTEFFGKKVYSPNDLFDQTISADKIVILTDSFDEIRNQIVDAFPKLGSVIENKYYFYKRSIVERYNNTNDIEVREILDYLKTHSLDVFNYEFVEKYSDFVPVVERDDSNGLLYVNYKDKRMYFSRALDTVESVRRYYKSICVEQDLDSPHRYLTKDFCVRKGDHVLDLGVAEGNFSLDIIDQVSMLYLMEADPLWVEALEYTFKPYSEKVKIIKKYATSYCEGDFATIDSVINDKIDLIKMDIEGCEWDALLGAEEIIARSDDLRIVACCYHSDFDQILIDGLLKNKGFDISHSNGFMWFPGTCRQSYVSTRLNRGLVRATKSSAVLI